MIPTIAFVIGCASLSIVWLFTLILYERQNRDLKKTIETLWRQNNAKDAKIMAVDYEKLCQLDIQARSFATQIVDQKLGEYATPELGDIDIYDLEDFKVRKNAE